MRLTATHISLASAGNLTWFLGVPKADVMYKGKALPFAEGFDSLWSLASWQINHRGYRPQLLSHHPGSEPYPPRRFGVTVEARRMTREALVDAGVSEAELAADIPEWIAFGVELNEGVTPADVGQYVSVSLGMRELDTPGAEPMLMFSEISAVDEPQIRRQPPSSALKSLNDAPRWGASLTAALAAADAPQTENDMMSPEEIAALADAVAKAVVAAMAPAEEAEAEMAADAEDEEEDKEMAAALAAAKAKALAAEAELAAVKAMVVDLTDKDARREAVAQVAALDFASTLSADRRESLVSLAVSNPAVFTSTVETIRESLANAASFTAGTRLAGRMPAGGPTDPKAAEFERAKVYQREHNVTFPAALSAVRAEG